LAKHDLESDVGNPKVDDLDKDELAALKKWEDFYDGKYTHVGFVIKDGEQK